MEADKSQNLLRPLKIAHRLLAASSIAGTLLLKVPSENIPAWGVRIFDWYQAQAWWVLPCLVISVPTVEWFRRRIESRTVWRVVEVVLQSLRDKIFPNSGDPEHHHRVTLFRRRRMVVLFKVWPWVRKWPWTGWMVPVARSCHTTRNSKACFRAPDEADRAEGFAGIAWTTRSLLLEANLPELTPDATDAQYQDYSKRTFVSVEYLKKRPQKSRSLIGFPIRVNGVNWGSIVIDSRSPALDEGVVKEHYGQAATVLSKLLEGVG